MDGYLGPAIKANEKKIQGPETSQVDLQSYNNQRQDAHCRGTTHRKCSDLTIIASKFSSTIEGP